MFLPGPSAGQAARYGGQSCHGMAPTRGKQFDLCGRGIVLISAHVHVSAGGATRGSRMPSGLMMRLANGSR